MGCRCAANIGRARRDLLCKESLVDVQKHATGAAVY